MEKPFCSPGLSNETISLLVNTDSIKIKDIDQHENPTTTVIIIQSTVEYMAKVQVFSAKEPQIITSDYDARVNGLLIVLMERFKDFTWQTSLGVQDIHGMTFEPPCCIVPDEDWNTSRLELGSTTGLEAQII